jgi:hypothetical protein
MKKILICFTLVTLSAIHVFGQTLDTINNKIQYSINGIVVDSKGGAVAYANVSLFKEADSIYLTGNTTNKEGKFSLQAPSPGNYFLHITAIGYAETKTASFTLSPGSLIKDAGIITIKDDVKTLSEVSVTALRPTIEQKADRMVVHIEGTALAAGNTAFDVLSRAPGVFIDAEGNIQLNGRSGVTVMLNNKLTFLSARDLRNMLESMSAENIKNIEIITNPSARYDAEGTSGILNINLKRNDRRGMNGSVHSGYYYNGKQHGYSAGGNINFSTGKWSSFLNLDYIKRVGGREATFTRIFYGNNKTTYFDQVATGNFEAEGPPSIRFGSDYHLNDNHSVGITANYTRNRSYSDFLTETFIGSVANRPTQFIDADNFSNNRFQNFTINGHYVGKLDTLGTTISTDVDYVNIRHRNESHFYNYFTNLLSNNTVSDFLYTFIPSGYDIYSGKIDFVKPFSNGRKVELGAKASRVVSDNDSRFYFNNNSLVLDPLRTNHFNYKENIYAAYINYSGTLSKKLNLQAGLRAENTESVGNLYTTGEVTERNYLNLFPSVFLQQKVNENYGINYSYSRRLSRPNYGNLNPFIFYRDPYTYIQGNPYLRPQYTHAFSINQNYKRVYNLTLSYNLTKDVISELPLLYVEDTTTVYYIGNVDVAHSVSMTGVAPLKIMKKWDTQNTILLNYSTFSLTDNSGSHTNNQLFFMLQSNHTILLPKDFRMELNLLFRGPAASGLYHMQSMHRVDAGLKKSFLNKKFDLTLNVNDIFKGYRLRWSTDLAGNVNEFDQYLRLRNVGVTVRYNFSKGKKVDIKRRTTIEELNRT